MPNTFVADASAGWSAPFAARRRDLPVDEAQELEPGVHPREVELHPLLVDDPASRRRASSPAPSARTSSSARSTMPDEQSVTRSWLSWLVMSRQPSFSSPTRVRRRDAHVLVEDLVDVGLAHHVDRHAP